VTGPNAALLMNLATNAAHAMERGGILQVQLGPHRVVVPSADLPELGPGLYARLSVIDSGHGMSEEVRSRAFEPFFTTKGVGAGTGLGLSVIHGIVESHAGAISVRSAPGQGTCVDVYLPAHVAQVSAGGEAVSAERAVKQVLLVDDEPLLASMLQRQLTSLGFAVNVHTSSLTALEAFRAQPNAFHLMITDNTMPHMTGLALAKEILSQRPELPVLLISGLGAEQSELDELGIARLLPKPYTFGDLARTLRELVGSASLGPP